jgi:hypothetical protein
MKRSLFRTLKPEGARPRGVIGRFARLAKKHSKATSPTHGLILVASTKPAAQN